MPRDPAPPFFTVPPHLRLAHPAYRRAVLGIRVRRHVRGDRQAASQVCARWSLIRMIWPDGSSDDLVTVHPILKRFTAVRILSIMQYVGAGSILPTCFASLGKLQRRLFVWGKGRSPNMSLVFETLVPRSKFISIHRIFRHRGRTHPFIPARKWHAGSGECTASLFAALQCFLVPLGTLLWPGGP